MLLILKLPVEQLNTCYCHYSSQYSMSPSQTPFGIVHKIFGTLFKPELSQQPFDEIKSDFLMCFCSEINQICINMPTCCIIMTIGLYTCFNLYILVCHSLLFMSCEKD